MSNYLKKAKLVVVLMLVISLYLPGNVQAAPEASDLYRASFGKKLPANHNENVDPSKVKLEWGSISNIYQYVYCYYSYELPSNICDINNKATWKSNGTSTSVLLPTLMLGTKYYWQVGAKLKDNDFVYADGTLTSRWTFTTSTPGVAGVGVYDDISTKWFYSGTWSSSKPTAAFKDTIHSTSTIGSTAEMAFNGSMFLLTYTQRADRGRIKIYVDGDLVTTLNAYSDTAFWQQIYRSPIYPYDNHIVRFEHAGPAGTYIDIDAIQILNAPLGTGTYDDINSNWFYSEAWTATKPTSAVNDTIHSASTIGEAAELAFNGSRFALTYVKRPNRGSINVFVDGDPVDTIDANSATTTWQAAWISPLFTQGNHVVRFEHAGPAGTYIDIDAIRILGIPVGAGHYDDTDGNWFYSGTWTASTSTPAVNDTIHTSGMVGAYADLAFRGSRFALTYVKRPNRGLINIYLDGDPAGTIDAHSATTTWQATWISPLLTPGNHTLRFEHAGPAGTYIDIDDVQVFSAPLRRGTYDDTNSDWFYSGNWAASTPAPAANGTIHSASTIGDAAELAFNGSRFALTYVKRPTRGLINVFVDGDPAGTIDAHSDTVAWQTIWVSPLFTPGRHVVRFEHAGPAGTYIDIDAIQVIGTPVNAGFYDDTNSNWFYSGNWITDPVIQATNGTIHKTNTLNDTAELSFNGIKFVLTYTKKPNRGLINVYLDGDPIGTIDAHSDTIAWQSTWAYTIPAGPTTYHTVTFEYAGPAGTFVDIDLIKIVGP